MKPELNKYRAEHLFSLLDSGRNNGWNEAIDSINAFISELEADGKHMPADIVREALWHMGKDKEKNEN